MSEFLLRWPDAARGGYEHEDVGTEALALCRIAELYGLGHAAELFRRMPVKLAIKARIIKKVRRDSPASAEVVAPPPIVADAGVGDVVSQQEPEPREQVAGDEGSLMREGPGAPGEKDCGAGASRPAGSAVPGEGATASPAAAIPECLFTPCHNPADKDGMCPDHFIGGISEATKEKLRAKKAEARR